MRDVDSLEQLREQAGGEVCFRGWVVHARSSGKIAFATIRLGADAVQVVMSKGDLSDDDWQVARDLAQEDYVEIEGTASEDQRAPGGVEVHAGKVTRQAEGGEFPISPKEHGTAFLMDHRHLWLRSSRPRAILSVRHEVVQAIRDYFYDRGFVLIDSPILTPAACEGTSTLFATDYFGDEAFLSQSGQLYLEPAAAALGKVYCFGPTFRAEKSKTRRHLTEFWMVEPEVAGMEFDALCELAEDFLSAIVARVLDRCGEDLAVLERDTAPLEAVTAPFPRISYTEAVDLLVGKGFEVEWGDDFGADEETALAEHFDRPVMVHRYPTEAKAFYMQPDPEDERVVLALDVLAPEGYGEIVGGSQRIHDYDLLLDRIRAHELPEEAFQWYLDVRRYGTFPHSGFGMGVERFVGWMCGTHHVRETIPYPRTLTRLYP